MPNDFQAAGFGIKLNSRALDPALVSSVLAVRVEDEVNVPTLFAFKLSTFDFAKAAWRGIDLEAFKPGDQVEVSMGRDRLKRLVTGEITALEPSFGAYSTMEVRGYDRLYRLNFGRRTRTFVDRRDSQIAAEVAAGVGLSPVTDTSPVVNPYVLQNNQSDYELVLERAARIDYEVWVDDRTFHFAKPREGAAPVATLRFDFDVQEIDLRLKVLTQGSRVEVRGWDAQKKKAVKGTATSAAGRYKMGGRVAGQQLAAKLPPSPLLFAEWEVASDKSAGEIAGAQYVLALDELIDGEASLPGRPEIRAGVNVKIEGLGSRFTGLYYVTASTHSFDYEEGYRTAIRLRRTGI